MTLRKLLENVSETSREDVSAAGCDWLESEKEASKIAGLEVLVQLSFVEGHRFADRLPRMISAIHTWTITDMLEENRFLSILLAYFVITSVSSLVALLNGNMLMLRNCAEAATPHAESREMYRIICNCSTKNLS